MEFKNVVGLLVEGKSYEEVKRLAQTENLFAASTPARANQVYSTVTARVKSLNDSFYPIFIKG